MNNTTPTATKFEEEKAVTLLVPQASPRKYHIVYPNLITFGYWHIAGLYGLYLCFTSAKWQTVLFCYILMVIAELGITAGAHRLWAHKTYKAKLPLQIILMIMNSIAFQNSAIDWVRDHRLHHKYSDTDADPHNAVRGFFYSHVGWLLVRKHPEVKKRGKELDMSDIYNNPVLRFQKKYAIPFIGTVCFGLPTLIPVCGWGETWTNAWHIAMLRYIINLNVTFLVNSAAHIWGYKPYDKNILPTQNPIVSILTFGEGFHNYHHTFPWDYRTAELGNNALNFTTIFIDFFAWIGWAYDLKTVSSEVIKLRAKRTGDGTNLWGWDDKDFLDEMKNKEGRRNKLRSNFGDEVGHGEWPHHVLIFRLYNRWKLQYRAFCAGSIIGERRVLTSANCFLTNRKRHRHNYRTVRFVAGILKTIGDEPVGDGEYEQWRSMNHIYSQKFYRFPAFNLAIANMTKPWVFNDYVNKIPYASKEHDFDGVCTATAVKATRSWSSVKYLYTEEVEMLQRAECERLLCRSFRIFMCTVFDNRVRYAYSETEGGGIVCYETGDSAEVDKDQGVLVAVTSIVNLGLPNIHMRIGMFNKWITDACCNVSTNKLVMAICIIVSIIKTFLV